MFVIMKTPSVSKPFYAFTEQGVAKFTKDPWHAARFSPSEVYTVVKHLNMLAGGDYLVESILAKEVGIF